MEAQASLATVLEWFEKAAQNAVRQNRLESAALWTDGHAHLTRLAAQRDELLAALQVATSALEGGVWDYGPGQDEHDKCNEVIALCRGVIVEVNGGEA